MKKDLNNQVRAGRTAKRAAALLLAAVLFFVLSGCGSGGTSSRAEVPSNSDPVLDLMPNAALSMATGAVRNQSKIEDIAVFSFFSKYADSMATQKMYDYSDICTDTVENARVCEFFRCRIAFLRLTGMYYWDYGVSVTAYSRTENSDGTVTIGVSATESYSARNEGSVLEQSAWTFVLGHDGEKNMIISVELLSRTSDYIYDNLNDAFAATGLPLETPEQIHAAGDAIIQSLYENKILPYTANGQFGNYLTVALPYTDDYVLIYSPPPYSFTYGATAVGLADKDGNVIFDTKYQGIGVTENGYFVLNSQSGYMIINPEGEQIATYEYVSCYTVYDDGIDSYHEAVSYGEQPAAPYSAKVKSTDGKDEYLLLDEKFQPVGGSYSSLVLSEEGATATRDGSIYFLGKDGNVISKKDAGVIETFYGKYQLTIWYISCLDGSARYGLLDENGNVIYKQNYCRIEMPFEDRVILFTGNNQSATERSATLADPEGNILNAQYNLITYLVTEDGYIGIAKSYGPDSEVEIGCEEAGCWLVDKDGNPVSEKYSQIGNYINESDGLLYINADDTTSPLIFEAEDGTETTVPLADVLIASH